MRSLSFLLPLSLLTSSVLALANVARDVENNVLIGYYDGESFKHKIVPMNEEGSTGRGGTGRFRRVTSVYYAEIFYALPGTFCYVSQYPETKITITDPFVPYEGHLVDISTISCVRVLDDTSGEMEA